MRVYYDDHEIQITSLAVYVGGRCYHLDQMERVWRRGGMLAGRRILVGLAVLVGAVLIRLAASWSWWRGGLRSWLARSLAQGGTVRLAVAAQLALSVIVLGILAAEAALRAIEYLRRHGRHMELWAWIDGSAVLLWRTNDAARFSTVCRALSRAMAR